MAKTKIKNLMEKAHDYAKRQGFWDHELDGMDPDKPVAPSVNSNLAKLMLIVTEVAEAAEAVRAGDHDNFSEELADTCIRLFDLAYANMIDLEAAIDGKMKLNELRSRMHGKLA